eukprot:gnl/Dysnectes_brevis/4458_a6000_547.p1 GENE.gnl/Dysnectes_brevis/4458_a6000_547~~gnl/Dysnectes_brevis/4458_a6000_547.p1  ORF type:complete len:290 (-),score=49.88 gnl/Dysnectes_brevis/4458_a6000_547:75-944(-)
MLRKETFEILKPGKHVIKAGKDTIEALHLHHSSVKYLETSIPGHVRFTPKQSSEFKKLIGGAVKIIRSSQVTLELNVLKGLLVTISNQYRQQLFFRSLRHVPRLLKGVRDMAINTTNKELIKAMPTPPAHQLYAHGARLIFIRSKLHALQKSAEHSFFHAQQLIGHGHELRLVLPALAAVGKIHRLCGAATSMIKSALAIPLAIRGSRWPEDPVPGRLALHPCLWWEREWLRERAQEGLPDMGDSMFSFSTLPNPVQRRPPPSVDVTRPRKKKKRSRSKKGGGFSSLIQ